MTAVKRRESAKDSFADRIATSASCISARWKEESDENCASHLVSQFTISQRFIPLSLYLLRMYLRRRLILRTLARWKETRCMGGERERERERERIGNRRRKLRWENLRMQAERNGLRSGDKTVTISGGGSSTESALEKHTLLHLQTPT